MQTLYWAGALLLAGAISRASGASQDMLVPTGWLAEKLSDPHTIVFHVGSQKDYDDGHIPGARLLTLADISTTGPGGLRLQLPDVKVLEDVLGRAGVSDHSRIVIYAGTDSVQSATRAWFTFDYLGLADRTSLLDGGLSRWRAEGRPVTTEKPVVKPARFTSKPRPELVVDADWVHSHSGQPGVRLLDARTPEFYSGDSAGNMPRAGHIPGARNVPYTTALNADRTLKPPEALRELMNAQTGETIVTYCHIGQQATVLYFVARYLGLEPHLYDGSFQDWSSRPELPVERKP